MNRRGGLYVFAIFALMIAFIGYFHIPEGDDIYSLFALDSYMDSGRFPSRLSAWLAYAADHYDSMNGRSGDKLLSLCMLLPRWCAAIMMGATAYGIFYYSSAIALGRTDMNLAGCVSVSSLVVLAMPWGQWGLIMCGFINYVVATFFSLFWVHCFFFGLKRSGALRLCAMFLFSVILGSWHEMFSVSLVIIALISGAADYRRSDAFRAILLAGLCAGLLLTLASPGFHGRAEGAMSIPHLSSMLQNSTFLYGLPCFAGIIVGSVAIVRGLIRRQTPSATEISVFVSFLVCVAFAVTLILTIDNSYVRVWWLADMFAIIIICYVWRRSCAYGISGKIAAVLFILALSNLSAGLYSQVRIYIDHEKIMELYDSSDDGVVYFDENVRESVPLIAFGKAQKDIYTYIKYIVPPDNLKNGHELRVLPAEFSHICETDLEQCTVGSRFYRTPSGRLLADLQDPNPRSFRNLDFIDEQSGHRTVYCLCQRIELSSGKGMTYVQPLFHAWEISRDISVPLCLN